jgi:hypothetical protein
VGYAYSDIPDDIDESKELNLLLENSLKEGHLFISDSDARPIGGAHPKAHLWDNGSSATDELNALMQIRSKALNQLSLNHIKDGAPYSDLEDLFVPMYLLHRYQVEAVVKMIGGVDYNYAIKGPIPFSVEVVSPTQQRNALLEYLNALNPKALKIPSHLNKLLHPRSFSNPRTRENFLSQTGVTFDYLGIASSLGDALIGMLLHPERANRLVMQFGFDKNQLSLKETLNILINNHFKKTLRNTHENQLNEIVKGSILKHLMHLGQNSLASSITKATVYEQLEALDRWLAGQSEANFSNFYRMEIQNYFDNPSGFNLISSKRLPDGSPIGSFSCDY